MDNGAIGISQDELQDLLDAFADELKPILHKKKRDLSVGLCDRVSMIL